MVLTLVFFNDCIGQDTPIVEQILILGNIKTKREYLEKFIQTQPGDKLDTLKIDEDLRKLRNLSSILETKWHTTPHGNNVILIYEITERITIFPLGDFGVSHGQNYFGVGAMETNAFGRGIYLYGFYRYNGEHSIHTIFKIPYLKGSNYGLHARFIAWNSRDPYYIPPEKRTYLYSFIDAKLSLKYEFNTDHRILAGIVYLQEDYELIDIEASENWPQYTYLEKPGFQINHTKQFLNYDYFRLSGYRNRVYLNWLKPLQPQYQSYFTITNELKLFKTIPGGGNIAFRNFLGYSTQQFEPFTTFTLDSYENIRGIGYKSRRGHSIAIINAEYRQTLFKGDYLGFQLVGFTDMGAVKQTGFSFSEMFSSNNIEMYYGLGTRIVVLQAQNAVLRLDYGISTNNFNNRNFVFSWGQYF